LAARISAADAYAYSKTKKARREVVGAGAKLICPHERLLAGLLPHFNFPRFHHRFALA